MTIKIVSLAQCPFCGDGTGDIFLDPRAAYDFLDEGNSSMQDNHIKLFTHNSPLMDDGPCPHLVWMWTEVSCETEQGDAPRCTWDVDTVWECAQLREIDDTCDPVHGLLYNIAYDIGLEEFLPREKHESACILAHWRGVGDAIQDVFQISGRALFAQHVPCFVDGLIHQEDRLQTAWKAGRDPYRERQQLRAQRKREFEYEDVYLGD